MSISGPATQDLLEESAIRLFELSLDPLCVVSIIKKQYLLVNQAFVKMLGYPAEQLLSRSLLDFARPEDRARTIEDLTKLESGVDTLDFENRIIRQNGDACYVSWHAKSDGSVAFAVARDTTKQKMANEIEKVEQTNFIRSICDSMREPLKSILAAIKQKAANRTLELAQLEHPANDISAPLRAKLLDIQRGQEELTTIITEGNNVLAAVVAELKASILHEKASAEPKRILVVDAVAEYLERVKQFFLGAGHHCDTAENAEIACVQFMKTRRVGEHYDFIFLNSRFGTPLVRQIREHEKQVKTSRTYGMINSVIVAWAENVTKAEEVSVIAAGMDMLIAKPQEMQDLLPLLETTYPCQLSESLRELAISPQLSTGFVLAKMAREEKTSIQPATDLMSPLALSPSALTARHSDEVVVATTQLTPAYKRRLIELALVPMCVISLTQEHAVLANPELLKAFGYPADQVLYKTLLKFVHPDDRARTVDDLAKLATGKMMVDFENRIVCEKGIEWFSWRAIPDETRSYAYVVARVVTAQKTAKEHEKDMRKKFIRAVCHALRNPLHSMFVSNELMALNRKLELEQLEDQASQISVELRTALIASQYEQRRLGDIITNNIEYLVTIIEKLLASIATSPILAASTVGVKKLSEEKEISPVKKQFTILLVDDEHTNRRILSRMLSNAGHLCEEAANGEEAVAKFQSAYAAGKPYDFIFMDKQMPSMNGDEATRRIRIIEKALAAARSDLTLRSTPIIGLSANTLKEDSDACLAAGMDVFLTKPARRQVIIDVLTWSFKNHLDVSPPSLDEKSKQTSNASPSARMSDSARFHFLGADDATVQHPSQSAEPASSTAASAVRYPQQFQCGFK